MKSKPLIETGPGKLAENGPAKNPCNLWVNIAGSVILTLTIIIGGYLNTVYVVEILNQNFQFQKLKKRVVNLIRGLRFVAAKGDVGDWRLDPAADGGLDPSTHLSYTDGRTAQAKALYFNGVNSYLNTRRNFREWRKFKISFWVRTEKIAPGSFAVIFDNGHSATANFALQTADASGERWVWHCNGSDTYLTIPLHQWTHVAVSANTDTGLVAAWVNEVKVGEEHILNLDFGATPLTLGRLANSSDRFFKGAIADFVVQSEF